jgi:hypothetical protein
MEKLLIRPEWFGEKLTHAQVVDGLDTILAKIRPGSVGVESFLKPGLNNTAVETYKEYVIPYLIIRKNYYGYDVEFEDPRMERYAKIIFKDFYGRLMK